MVSFYKKINSLGVNKKSKDSGKSNERSYFNNIKPIFEIFFDGNVKFKNISEIINNEKFKNLDKKIIYAIFSSKSFLSNINISNLSEEELNIISESLAYTCDNDLKQIKLSEQLTNLKIKLYLLLFKKNSNIIGKVANLNKTVYNSFAPDTFNNFFKNPNYDFRQMYLADIKKQLSNILGESSGFKM